MSSLDSVRSALAFVPEKQFLLFAPVSRIWREAWGKRSAITNWFSPDSSV